MWKKMDLGEKEARERNENENGITGKQIWNPMWKKISDDILVSQNRYFGKADIYKEDGARLK